MADVEKNTLQRSLTTHFCTAISSTLGHASKTAVKCEIAEEPCQPLPPASESICLRFGLSGSVEGNTFFVLQRAKLQDLGLPQLLAAVDDEARLQGLSAAFEVAGTQLAELLGAVGAVRVTVQAGDPQALPAQNTTEIICSLSGEQKPFSFHLSFDDGLLTSMERASASAFNYPVADPGAASSNLDLVLDVELAVTLRFGQRQLPLREVLDLTSGSVVELDRQVDEPVELILDGKVVARGEAVIIDGNYGMRITQVLQQVGS